MKTSYAKLVFLACLAVVAFVGLFQYTVLGQDSPASMPVQEKVATKVYNVRDLIQVEQDHSFKSQVKPVTQLTMEPNPWLSGFGNCAVSTLPPTKQDQVNAILELIRSTIAAESWRENSGTIGTLREINGALVVAQTEANHKQIETLLEQLRKANAARRTVLVQAKWLELDGAGLDKLLGGSGVKAPAEVAADAIKDLPVRYRAQITGMEGQDVHLAAGRGQTVLSENFVSDPKTEMVHWGAILNLSAVMNPDGTATVDFSSLIAEPGEIKPIPMVQHKASSQPAVGMPESLDRLEFNLQSFGGTAKVPLGKPVLIGGSNLAPPGGGPNAKLLYLVLEVSASK